MRTKGSTTLILVHAAQDYKLRLAFKIIALLLEKFRADFSGSSAILWQRASKDLSFKYPGIVNVHKTVLF